MDNQLEVNSLESKPQPQKYFWIELETTKNGYEKLSYKLDGKHYVGFLTGERERKDKEGKAYGNYRLACMKECYWSSCSICHPLIII